jgi:hypothetical protein
MTVPEPTEFPFGSPTFKRTQQAIEGAPDGAATAASFRFCPFHALGPTAVSGVSLTWAGKSWRRDCRFVSILSLPRAGPYGGERRFADLGGKELVRRVTAPISIDGRRPQFWIKIGLAKHRRKHLAARRSDRAIDLTPIDDEHEARYRLDMVFRGQRPILIDIDLPHRISGRDELLHDGIHRAAGTAPIGAKIVHDGVAAGRDG